MKILNQFEQKQLAYIVGERGRYRRLDRLRRRLMLEATGRGYEPQEYKQAAYVLGLHAQQADEIEARLAQLKRMESELRSGTWWRRAGPIAKAMGEAAP